MLKVRTGLRFGSLFAGSLLLISLAAPAHAGSVYSWVTEDGTHAFTDDAKRIPAKHRQEAKRRSMGKLTRYERYTEVSADQSKPYAERIRERQAELRGVTTAAPQGAIVGGLASSGPGVEYALPVSGSGTTRQGASLRVPLDAPAPRAGSRDDIEDEPMTIESKRMKPRDSMATRHWTFVQRGDEIITVIKGEKRQRSLKAFDEGDYDF